MSTFYAIDKSLINEQGELKPEALARSQVKVFRFDSRKDMNNFLNYNGNLHWLAADQMTKWQDNQNVQIINRAAHR